MESRRGGGALVNGCHGRPAADGPGRMVEHAVCRTQELLAQAPYHEARRSPQGRGAFLGHWLGRVVAVEGREDMFGAGVGIGVV